MKQIYANNFTTLSLGRQGENLARKVVFDVRDLESLYGHGDVEVIHQRPGDAQPYPLAVQRDGTLVTWNVTATDTEMSADTANERYGKCELRYYAGETLAKSQIWRTWVESAMDTPSETAPPEPEQGWVDQVLEVGVSAKEATDSAKTYANSAEQSASGAAQSAQEAAESASAAHQSATSAAESAAVYDNVVADVTQLKQDVAAIMPDDTAVDGKPWTSKKIVDSLCQPFEESGNPVQVYPVENYPLGVKVQIEPTQEGSGDPSPDNIRPITGLNSVSVTRCSKNLLDLDLDAFNKASFWMKSSIISPYLNRIKFKPNTQYTISLNSTLLEGSNAVAYLMIDFTDGTSMSYGDAVIVDARTGVDGTNVITSYQGKSVERMRYIPSVDGLFTLNSIQIEEGATPTTYEQYNGDTYDIALPETVYGGTLDVESGVVTVDYGHIASYAGEPLPGEWISDRDVYAADATPTTGAQVAYKLAEPRTIQLTPQQITALSGVNTILTDADGVVVTGSEDPKHTITELKNAIISLGGNI